ncbi:MAG TPA: hypothetical protein VK660_10180 [Xanthomonadaceae bacterium]|jgi:hypothetical protein|nr:hypothetical protein [Xanthomonadaceae bacterium]
MKRVVESELLDALPSDDPRAVRSRNDLRRINRLMGNQSVLGDALDSIVCGAAPMHLIELGAGDGTLLLRLARRRAKRWPKVKLGLLDMQPVVRAETLMAYQDQGWDAQIIAADVFDWLAQSDLADAPIIVANLFVHHFDGTRLPTLLKEIAGRARAFICCEPRRSQFSLAGSRLLGLIGCNQVTRHDAVVSVRAGFKDKELSALWPDPDRWSLQESLAAPFGHRFVAVRNASSG